MYCFIKVKGYCQTPDEMASNFDLKLCPVHHTGYHRNLKIKLAPSGAYSISGSIWVWYKGDNAGLFTMKECQQAVAKLDSLTCDSFLKSDVIRFELGVNIEVVKDPVEYLDVMMGTILKGRIKPFFPSYSKKRLWQKSTQQSFSNFKCYSKSLDQNIADTNVLRIERVVSNVKGHFKRTLQVESLLDESNYIPWMDELREAADNLILKASFKPSPRDKLSAKEAYKRLLLSEVDLPLLLRALNEYGLHQKTIEGERTSIKKILANNDSQIVIKNELVHKIHERLKIQSYV